MNFINLPLFILLFAFVYLSIVYGLLKIAESAKQPKNIIYDNSQTASPQIEVPLEIAKKQ